MTSTDDMMTIRQMCETFDVTPRTLRFYEQKELLSPVRQGQKRLYSRTDRGRLTLILRGKRFGFSLEDIRQLLDMYNRDGSNQAQLSRTYALAQVRLEEMQRQHDELGEAIVELKEQMAMGQAALAGFRRAAE